MGKFLFTADYSSASWARLVNSSDDRFTTVNTVMESLGGSLELLYWTAHNGEAHCIADLPDLVAARAFVTAAFKTGAFKSVKGTRSCWRGPPRLSTKLQDKRPSNVISEPAHGWLPPGAHGVCAWTTA